MILALALACGPKGGESGDDGESSDPSETSNSPTTDINEPDPSSSSSTSGGPDETTTATDGPVETTSVSEPTATDPNVTEPDPSDTDPDPSDTDGPACVGKDPATDASFDLLFVDAWPDQLADEYDVDRVCVVDAVGVEAARVVTDITCDVDGAPLKAQFVIAAAPEGQVDWQAGQSVVVQAYLYKDEFGLDKRLGVRPADDEAALLVHGQDWWGEGVPTIQQIGPIVRERVGECFAGDIEDTRYELKYSLESGSTLGIWSGGRGSLVIDDAHLYAVDLDHADNDCCHGSEHSLVRRVVSEG